MEGKMIATHPIPRQSKKLMEKDLPARLLIVDDEPFNIRLLERVLAQDYQIVGAGSGEEALSLLEQQPFDVVLLDIMMPGVSGLQVLQTLRSQPETADLPVILVSAMSDSDHVARGLQMGANDYVTKPMDIEVARARVDVQVMLKRLQDERKHAIEQLKEAHEMKERIFRIASHDLKGPLTNLRMAQYLLRDIVGDNQDAITFLDTIETTIDSMRQVIDDFLNVAVMQGAAQDVQLDEVDTDKVVWDVIKQYNATAQNKDISLQVGSTYGMVMAEPGRLTQVVGNFVSNAIKYSPRSTIVTVWVESDDERTRISVADQGPGIPAAEREQLFGAFQKLSTRPTAGESSTGLGLWIVKQLIELQHGQVGVDCPPDGGSIFWVELPNCTQG
jgi:two-component system sensor histidine kinase/response regulator